MHFLIFSGGRFTYWPGIKKLLKSVDKTIAVDSGASHCISLKLTPDFLIGDFDSIDPKLFAKLQKQKVKTLRYPTDKDKTDTDLAIELAIREGAKKITILAGAEGDRIDHILGNIFNLQKYKTPIFFVSQNQILWLMRGPKKEKIYGQKGDQLSIISLSEIKNIKTSGLKYPLVNDDIEPNSAFGNLNELTQNTATIEFKNGTLLLIHTDVA